jgi:hypothetical protein
MEGIAFNNEISEGHIFILPAFRFAIENGNSPQDFI